MLNLYLLLIWHILANWYVLPITACKPDPAPAPPPPPPACSIGKSIKDYLDDSTFGNKREKIDRIPNTVVVEVLVVIDYSLSEKIGTFYKDGVWRAKPSSPKTKDRKAEAILYVRKFMSAVAIKFRRHFKKPRIQFSIAGVLVGEPQPFIVDKDGFDILQTHKNMKQFFGNETYKARFPFDVVLLLTGEESFKKMSGLDEKYGLTEVGRACDYERFNFGPNLNHANIIVQDLGQFSGVKTATHQFGHILGSYSDGEKSSKNCCSREGYIMSKNKYDKNNIDNVFKNKRNAYKWSTCSKEVISNFVRNASCLFNTPTEDPYPLFNWQELTQNWQVPHLSDQCSVYVPEKEDVELVDYVGYDCGNDPCQFLECQTVFEQCFDCLEHLRTDCKVQERQNAMEGSMCGENKNCFQGNCINGKKAVGSLENNIRTL